jgi:uncharacterized membrane protein YeaQ/YmgE (transglycosylase-associated protein family)
MIGRIIALIIVGLVVGALGRLIHPGRDPMGIGVTVVIGVAATLVAGLLIGGVLGFVVAVVVAALLVALVGRMMSTRATQRA